jgi:hypothetical protein
MPKLSTDIIQQIKMLSKAQLESLVLKMAAKDQSFYDFLQVNYLDKESGERDLFVKTQADLTVLFSKRYKGFSEQLQLANMLNACVKRVNEFVKISKNKELEADLLLFILDEVFAYAAQLLGTCFTTFDTRLGIILRRLIHLVDKLHPDHFIVYQDKINKYLVILHRTSNFIDTIYNLPQAI